MSRLHEALQGLGVDSRLLVRHSTATADAVETIATRGDADELSPAVRAAVVRQYVELNRTGISNTHFSLHIDGADVSRTALVDWSDIVHLHWTASFQTPADVRALFDAKPVVWTLHDLEPLTGGCHFPAGCEGYVDDCARCPQLVRDPFRITATTLRDKKTLWAGSRPTFVAPSRDIAERARRSSVLQRAEASIVHISHGIDVDVFHPRPKAAARRELGLPVNGLYVLCGSNYNAEQRKGLRFLEGALAAATAPSQLGPLHLTLLTVGEPKLDLRDLGETAIVQLGRVSLDAMPSVYAAADVFLHPSVEDNFPGMVLESLSCGVPAIAFDVGGVPDIVHDGVSGRLVPAGDERAMGAALSSLVRDPDALQRMSERARAHVEEHFSDMSIARRHAELYDDVIANRAVPRPRTGGPGTTGIDAIFPRWSTACLVAELVQARERAADVTRASHAKSEHIAALERNAAELAAGLAEQSRQVHEKQAELSAIHQVAEERNVLAQTLHASAQTMRASAARAEASAASLQSDLRERDDRLARLEATIDEQRAEIELVHRIAADRSALIEDLHRAESEHVAALEREAAALALNLAAMQSVAEERKALTEELHASAARMEALAASLQREVEDRNDKLAALAVTVEEQRAEIELVHRVAADREVLIENLHHARSERVTALEREAAELARTLDDRSRQVQEKDAALAAIHDVAEERNALAARLQREVRVRDDQLAKLAATIEEQRAEIELVHGVAAERAALIDRLAALADAAP